MSGICLFIALSLEAECYLRKHSFEIGQLKMVIFLSRTEFNRVKRHFPHESVILRVAGSFST